MSPPAYLYSFRVSGVRPFSASWVRTRVKAAALETHLTVVTGLPATTEPVYVEVVLEVPFYTWNIVRCLAAVVAVVVLRT